MVGMQTTILLMLCIFFFYVFPVALGRIPKLHQSRYAFFGIAFSEKTWMYLLALQLLVSEGLDSIAAGFCGFLAGYLYDHDSIGLQKLRLPQAVQVCFCSTYFLIQRIRQYEVPVLLRCCCKSIIANLLS